MNYNETITLKTDRDFLIGCISRWEIENYALSPSSLQVKIKNGDLVVNDKLFFRNEKPTMKAGEKVRVYYFKAEIKDEVPTEKDTLINTLTL